MGLVCVLLYVQQRLPRDQHISTRCLAPVHRPERRLGTRVLELSAAVWRKPGGWTGVGVGGFDHEEMELFFLFVSGAGCDVGESGGLDGRASPNKAASCQLHTFCCTLWSGTSSWL